MRAIYVTISLVSCLLIAFAIGCSHRQVYYVAQPELRDVQLASLVRLRDQFGVSRGVVGDIEYFATPTSKTNANSGNTVSIKDTLTHLTWYRYRPWSLPFFGSTEVTFHNQLSDNDQIWRISRQPAYLLVPTAKNNPDDPKREESKHFLCYEVLDPKSQHYDGYTLGDQFNDSEDIQIIQPLYFCTPVKKIIGSSSDSVSVDLDGEHLACYRVASQEPAVANTATISNQFDGDRELILRKTYMLCVPSNKKGVKAIPGEFEIEWH